MVKSKQIEIPPEDIEKQVILDKKCRPVVHNDDIFTMHVNDKGMNKTGDSHSHSYSHPGPSNEGSLENLGTDTDSGLSGSILGENSKVEGRHTGGLSETSSPTCLSPKNGSEIISPNSESCVKESPESPDAGVDLGASGSSSPDEWHYEKDEATPLQFKIEEHIEEITTHHVTEDELSLSDDSDGAGRNKCPRSLDGFLTSDSYQSDHPKSSYKRYSSTSSLNDPLRILPSFDFSLLTDCSVAETERVPFPELGVDLLHESSSAEDGGPSEVLLENTDWTENWKFRKGLSNKYRSVKVIEATDMFIPNPSTNIGPTIGDRDIDELSELSEQYSSCSIDSFSDEEEVERNVLSKLPVGPSNDLLELVGEINNEFGQKDHEYTEDFSVIDRRQILTTRCSSREATSRNRYVENRSLYSGFNHCSASMEFLRQSEDFTEGNTDSLSPKCLLTPPQSVPEVIDNSNCYSITVWFESFPQTQLVPSGKALRLSCQVRGKKNFDISWFFKGSRLEDDENIITWQKRSIFHLNLFEFTENDAGTYIVAAYTQDHCVWASCQVLCADQLRAEKPPMFHTALSDVTVEAGCDVTLECQVSGHPEPKVSFIRNSLPLKSSSITPLIENDQYGTWSIQLVEVKERDGGEIKAIASNSVGQTSTTCTVSVIPEAEDSVSSRTKELDGRKFIENTNYKKIIEEKKRNVTKGSTVIQSCKSDKFSQSLLHMKELLVSNEKSWDSHNFSSLQSNLKCNDNRKLTDDSMRKDTNGHLFQPPQPGIFSSNEELRPLKGLQKSFSLPCVVLPRFISVINFQSTFSKCDSVPSSLNINQNADGKGTSQYQIHKSDSSSTVASFLSSDVGDIGFDLDGSGGGLSSTESNELAPFHAVSDGNFVSGSCANNSNAIFLENCELENVSKEKSRGSCISSALPGITEEILDDKGSELINSLPPKPGTIAEREHRKWLEAKPLVNNPYSAEKLVHRLDKSSKHYPSLPVNLRDSPSSEYIDASVSTPVDLSRYSRDYHVHATNTTNIQKDNSNAVYKLENIQSDEYRTNPSLVKLETKQFADWKEELKDIRLDVGKKVANLQKTIDKLQQDWGKRMHQKGYNPVRNKYKKRPFNNKLSTSCMDLTSPPSKTRISAPNPPVSYPAGNRHLVYSSTEALNISKKDSHNHLWRTVSENTLATPAIAPQISKTMGESPSNYFTSKQRYSSRESLDSKTEVQNRRYSCTPNSDSDDSSVMNYRYNGPYQHHQNRQKCDSYTENRPNGSYYSENRPNGSYYSENSVESLKEESDTEDSVSLNESLPSVKELAQKFNSMEFLVNAGNETKIYKAGVSYPSKCSKSLDPNIRNGNVSNNLMHGRKYENKLSTNEVHHSLTARSVSRQFREGLRKQTSTNQTTHLDPATDEHQSGAWETQDKQTSQSGMWDKKTSHKRDTSSPEHLGIPSSPASIPQRYPYAYNQPGDTSDDSQVSGGLTPRKNYRKKYVNGIPYKGVSNYKSYPKRDAYVIY